MERNKTSIANIMARSWVIQRASLDGIGKAEKRSLAIVTVARPTRNPKTITFNANALANTILIDDSKGLTLMEKKKGELPFGSDRGSIQPCYESRAKWIIMPRKKLGEK